MDDLMEDDSEILLTKEEEKAMSEIDTKDLDS